MNKSENIPQLQRQAQQIRTLTAIIEHGQRVDDMNEKSFVELQKQVANLRALLAEALAQRDEARREVSKLMGGSAEQKWYANRRGWECFKEDSK